MTFNPDNIKALCHISTHRDKLIEFDKTLSDMSYHRACEDGSERDAARAAGLKAQNFILYNGWGYDHIKYFFEQGGGSYLVTPDEFHRWLINYLHSEVKRNEQA
jgi:hypothetical protein